MDQTPLLLILICLCSVTVSRDYIYHFINETKNWAQAQQFCRTHYRDLVSVTSMAEKERVCPNINGCKNAWIGLFNKNRLQYNSSNREWHWTQSGQSYRETQAKWGVFDNGPEPNDYGGNENCAFVKKKDGKLYWGDICCCRTLRFICYDQSNERYVLIQDEKTWFQALQYCIDQHTYLVSGHDQLNDSSLASMIVNWQGDPNWWMGLFRDPWAWSNGSVSSFRNWAENAQVLSQREQAPYNKCATLGENNKWMSVDCSEEHPFICYDDLMVLVKEQKTWEEALLFCRRNYGDLAVMTDGHLQRMVQERAKMAATDFVWVGLHYVGFFEEWVWVNGKWVSSNDPNWENTEPNNCSVSGAMQRGGEKWVKKQSTEKYNFVCSLSC